MYVTKTKLQKIIREELEYTILEQRLIKEEYRRLILEQAGGNMAAAIMATKGGDKLKLIFQKNVRKSGVVVFKAGKEYEGKVQGEEVNVKHEKIVFVGDNKTMTKEEFIKSMKGEGDPCETLNCETSTIIRSGKAKTFTNYLNNPTFKEDAKEEATEEAPAEEAPAEEAPAEEAPAEEAPAEETPAEEADTYNVHALFDDLAFPANLTPGAVVFLDAGSVEGMYLKGTFGERILALKKAGEAIKVGEVSKTYPDEKQMNKIRVEIALNRAVKIFRGEQQDDGNWRNGAKLVFSTTETPYLTLEPGFDGTMITGADPEIYIENTSGVTEDEPEEESTALQFVVDGKPLPYREVAEKLRELGVTSLKGGWHRRPLKKGMCTDTENCTRSGRMKRNHPMRVAFRDWWTATHPKKSKRKKKEKGPMKHYPKGGASEAGAKAAIKKGEESVLVTDKNKPAVDVVKDTESQIKTLRMIINNTKIDDPRNAEARSVHDKLARKLNKAKKRANTEAGLGGLYKGVKRDKSSVKLSPKQRAVLDPKGTTPEISERGQRAIAARKAERRALDKKIEMERKKAKAKPVEKP